MYLNERNNEIYEYLKRNGRATVKELSQRFFVSTATVRRTLERLERLGVIKRVHGGAVYYDNSNEVSIYVRQVKNAELKQQVAEVAMKYLPHFSSVFIDNSSTCLQIGHRLDFSHKTVVTNGMQLASIINRQENVKLIMPGGEIRYNTNSVSGEMTCEALKEFRFDLMLCSCAQMDVRGCYEQSQEAALLKKVVLANSRMKILLVDETKLGNNATYRTADAKAFDAVVTNADDMTVQQYRQNGIRMFNR